MAKTKRKANTVAFFDDIHFSASYAKANQLPPSSLPEIVFSGKSNVGKSSLINKTFNRNGLAKVSQKPGKTTAINFFTTKEAIFADLPGYGFAKVSDEEKKRWSELTESYFSSNRNIALVICLVDIRHKPTQLDAIMIDFVQRNEIPFVIAATKADKISKQKRKAQQKLILQALGYQISDCVPFIACSSLTGEGIDRLRTTINAALIK